MFRDPYLEIISDLYFNPNSSLLDIQGRLNLSRFKSRRVIDRLEQNGVIQHIESGYVLSEIATNYAAHFYANSHEEFIVD